MFSSFIANICTLNQQGYFSINNDKVKRILCFCLNKLLLKKKKKKRLMKALLLSFTCVFRKSDLTPPAMVQADMISNPDPFLQENHILQGWKGPGPI